MPEQKTVNRARRAAQEGKSPSTQAGEFVHEEIEHIREGKHGARSAKQAIAIGLSKARRAGVDLPEPKQGTVSDKTRAQSKRDSAKGRRAPAKAPSPARSKAAHEALEDEGQRAASHEALSRQAKAAARKRSPADRSRAARKAAVTRARSSK